MFVVVVVAFGSDKHSAVIVQKIHWKRLWSCLSVCLLLLVLLLYSAQYHIDEDLNCSFTCSDPSKEPVDDVHDAIGGGNVGIGKVDLIDTKIVVPLSKLQIFAKRVGYAQGGHI